MAPIFRLQEEEPKLLTDAKQQEHCGNEAREQRVLVSTVSNFSNCAWQYDVRSSELQQTSINFIAAPRAARYPSGLRP
ncbi:hypothetical protein [Bradyrhizobium ottawaense]|uniref:hypothetical protein n=1 Tax=Bradyrhizobium ottawaense TaxID=931866 RepID=UPI003F9F35F9